MRRSLDLSANPSGLHHDETVRQPDYLEEVVTYEKKSNTLLDEISNDIVDFLLGSSVDTTSGVVDNQDFSFGGKPPSNNCLLLVSSAKRQDRGIWRRCLIRKRFIYLIPSAASCRRLRTGPPRMVICASEMFCLTENVREYRPLFAPAICTPFLLGP